MWFFLAAILFMYLGRLLGWRVSLPLYSAPLSIVMIACVFWGVSVAVGIQALIVWQNPSWLLRWVFGYALGAYVAIPNLGLVNESTVPDCAIRQHALLKSIPWGTYIALSIALYCLFPNVTNSIAIVGDAIDEQEPVIPNQGERFKEIVRQHITKKNYGGGRVLRMSEPETTTNSFYRVRDCWREMPPGDTVIAVAYRYFDSVLGDCVDDNAYVIRNGKVISEIPIDEFAGSRIFSPNGGPVAESLADQAVYIQEYNDWCKSWVNEPHRLDRLSTEKQKQIELVWKRLGIDVTQVSHDEILKFHGYGRQSGGLGITRIRHDGPAMLVGIEQGDVLFGVERWSVSSLDHAAYALSRCEQEIKLHILREGMILCATLPASSHR